MITPTPLTVAEYWSGLPEHAKVQAAKKMEAYRASRACMLAAGKYDKSALEDLARMGLAVFEAGEAAIGAIAERTIRGSGKPVAVTVDPDVREERL